jgi:hypothetical protein
VAETPNEIQLQIKANLAKLKATMEVTAEQAQKFKAAKAFFSPLFTPVTPEMIAAAFDVPMSVLGSPIPHTGHFFVDEAWKQSNAGMIGIEAIYKQAFQVDPWPEPDEPEVAKTLFSDDPPPTPAPYGWWCSFHGCHFTEDPGDLVSCQSAGDLRPATSAEHKATLLKAAS